MNGRICENEIDKPLTQWFYVDPYSSAEFGKIQTSRTTELLPSSFDWFLSAEEQGDIG
jgi:hypothetical protein